MSDVILWEASHCCPECRAFAVCKLPPDLLLMQPDDTTHVCYPPLGGCNRGYALDDGASALRSAK